MNRSSFVIRLEGHESSEMGANTLIASYLKAMSSSTDDSYIPITKFDAITPDIVSSTFDEEGLVWNYPWVEKKLDIQSGLLKTPYETNDPLKRMACFMSHYKLWKLSYETQSSMLIHEHDAIYNKGMHFDWEVFERSKFSVISINNPIGATRKSQEYANQLKNSPYSDFHNRQRPIISCPSIGNDSSVPQGLPGNSAYFIKPSGASKLINLVSEFGAWPNDAIMCRQLMPTQLGCSRTFYTSLQQQMKSSTTL